MEKKILFPQAGGFLHGGDYNPEQWLDRPDILKEDVRMMKKAGVNCVTLGVFPGPFMNLQKGSFISDGWKKSWIICTKTASLPFWPHPPAPVQPGWTETYPEAMRVSRRGCAITTAYGITIV